MREQARGAAEGEREADTLMSRELDASKAESQDPGIIT